MSRHFCCCIPVRVAVFVSSLLAFLFSGLVAGVAYFALIKNGDPNNAARLTSQQKIAFGVAGGVYTLIALVSLFGFVGSVIRKRGFVALYSTMAWIFFIIQAAASGFLIYALFHNVDVNGSDCHVQVNGKTENCTDISKAAKGVTIGFIVLQLIIQLYIVVVIRRYVEQLDEEQSYNRTSGHVESAFKMGPTNQAYYPHQPLDQGQGLLAPQGHYAYSDPHHSFGS